MVKSLEFLSENKLKKMRRLGLIREGQLQAYQIWKEFRNGLKNKLGSMKAIAFLAKKYHLSDKRIQDIVYKKQFLIEENQK